MNFNNKNIFSLLTTIILILIAVNISYQPSKSLLVFMKRPLIILVSLIFNLIIYKYDHLIGYAFFLMLILLYSNVQNIEIISEHFESKEDEKDQIDTIPDEEIDNSKDEINSLSQEESILDEEEEKETDQKTNKKMKDDTLDDSQMKDPVSDDDNTSDSDKSDD